MEGRIERRREVGSEEWKDGGMDCGMDKGMEIRMGGGMEG